MAEQKSRRGRNTFDKDTGLPVMVNLLIIRTLYYGMKNKADRFIEESTGRKKKYIPIYDMINISRSRYDRLQRGASFEITNREANHLAELFDIDIKYFRRDTPDVLQIPNVSMKDWKCYYNTVHEVGYALGWKEGADKTEEKAKAVKRELQKLVSKEWNAEEDGENPIFCIWYFFNTGKKYEKVNWAKECMNALQNVQLSEWDSLYRSAELEHYKNLLKKHYEYVNALVTIRNSR